MKLTQSNQKILLFLTISGLIGALVIISRNSQNYSMKDEYKSLKTGKAAVRAKEFIDINKASVIQLAQVKGIGPVLAKKIIKYRNEAVKISSMEELLKVNGIGEKKLEMLKKHFNCE